MVFVGSPKRCEITDINKAFFLVVENFSDTLVHMPFVQMNKAYRKAALRAPLMFIIYATLFLMSICINLDIEDAV